MALCTTFQRREDLQDAASKTQTKLFEATLNGPQRPRNLHLGLYSESTHSTELLSCAAAQLPKYRRASDLGVRRCRTGQEKQFSSNVQALSRDRNGESSRQIKVKDDAKQRKTSKHLTSDHQTIIKPSCFLSRPFLSSKLHGLLRLEHFFCPKARRVLKPQRSQSHRDL